MNDPNEKQEIIEQALQEAVGGGRFDVCGWHCSIGGINYCDLDICNTTPRNP